MSATSMEGEDPIVNDPMFAESKEEAIAKAKLSIAEDFGYNDWVDYRKNGFDPVEKIQNDVYHLWDNNNSHFEVYRVQPIEISIK